MQNERTFSLFSQALYETVHLLKIKISIFFPLENAAEAKSLFFSSFVQEEHKCTRIPRLRRRANSHEKWGICYDRKSTNQRYETWNWISTAHV